MRYQGDWPTPTARDAGRGGAHGPVRAPGDKRGLTLNDKLHGPPNPTFLEWLTGFPEGWSAVVSTAIPSVPAQAALAWRTLTARLVEASQ